MQQQPRAILPGAIASTTELVLVYDGLNPNNCPCGWYNFYGTCGHQYQQQPYKCGGRTTRSGKSGFCGIPAPQHVVSSHYVDSECAHCRRRRR
ncbi:hypothetical protein F5Y03DRAFT_363133 [Xylaria venustula]|nr:hypothetical protein F5Y03DRAFT_363133 [Xylaria venustula]